MVNLSTTQKAGKKKSNGFMSNDRSCKESSVIKQTRKFSNPNHAKVKIGIKGEKLIKSNKNGLNSHTLLQLCTEPKPNHAEL